jgi:soluble lytic murein transglycosylase-like protein
MAARGALLVSALTLAAAGAGQRADPPSVHAAPAAGSGETPGADAPAARAGAGRIARWRAYTIEASRRFGIPLAWIEEVMRAESGGRTRLDGRPITSHAGAMGLMQLMPGTWAEMRARYGLGGDPHDPRDNILAGSAYLAELYSQFGHPGLFGAYNAGPARYSAWLAGRGALPAETRNYLARLAAETAPGASFAAAKANAPPAAQAHSAPPRAQLFAIDRSPSAASPDHGSGGGEGLFVPLSADNLPLPQERSGP